MIRLRPWLLRTVAAALCWASPTPVAHATEAAPVETDKQKSDFELARRTSTCVPGSADPRDYPFSVDRLRFALQINGVRPQSVSVLVVDNGFIGYHREAVEDDSPAYVESKNFSPQFFGLLQQGSFLPFVDRADAGIAPEQNDPMAGHGTHIGGIVLGGSYETGKPREGGANLVEPNVRRLLLDKPDVKLPQDAKPWLTVRFVSVGFGAAAAGADPVAKLDTALLKGSAANSQIVNMSLTRILTSFSMPYRLPEGSKNMLVVLAAGNSTMHLRKSGHALPARLEENDRMLIVASHDANGALSEFSNYGDLVGIAAPGCQIQSWIDGEQDPVALSGTSMATAVVTFAAALVRSQLEYATGTGLRNRLLASARYEPQLAQCERSAAKTKEMDAPRECVSHGAMLDIAAAIVVRRDLIEYEECPAESAKGCKTVTAVGELFSVPRALTRCIGEQDMEYRGLSLNSGVKRVVRGTYLVASETGQEVGRLPLHWDSCPVSEAEESELVEFKVTGLQLNGQPVSQPSMIQIKTSQLVRLVTRMVSNDL